MKLELSNVFPRVCSCSHAIHAKKFGIPGRTMGPKPIYGVALKMLKIWKANASFKSILCISHSKNSHLTNVNFYHINFRGNSPFTQLLLTFCNLNYANCSSKKYIDKDYYNAGLTMRSKLL